MTTKKDFLKKIQHDDEYLLGARTYGTTDVGLNEKSFLFFHNHNNLESVKFSFNDIDNKYHRIYVIEKDIFLFDSDGNVIDLFQLSRIQYDFKEKQFIFDNKQIVNKQINLVFYPKKKWHNEALFYIGMIDEQNYGRIEWEFSMAKEENPKLSCVTVYDPKNIYSSMKTSGKEFINQNIKMIK